MRILGLTVVVLGLAYGTASATSVSVTCGYGTNPSGCGGSNTDNVFAFNPGPTNYSVEINFIGGIPHGTGFDVTVTDNPLTQPIPAGFECINFTGLPDGCRQFDVNTHGGTWNGNIEVTIAWALDTNTLYPNGTTDQVRMFHFHGTQIVDVTVPGSYFSAPVGCGNDNGHPNHPDPNPSNGCDPGVTGEQDSFDGDFVGHEISGESITAVPEPASLILLGSGLVGAAGAARRRARR